MTTAQFRWFVSIALVSLIWAPATAQFSAGERFSGFEPIDQYLLELDGVPAQGTRIFAAQTTPGILVLSPELPSPVILWPRSRQVELLKLMKVSENPSGSIDILPDPVLAPAGSFEVRNLEVHFSIEGRQAALKPRPWLLGQQDGSGLRAYSAAYAQRADGYVPAGDALDELRQQGRDVRVKIFFGSWCPACGQMVPRALKVEEQLEGTRVQFEYYGLPRPFSGDTEAERYNITSVPTGVIFIDGREGGRITGEKWRQPEKALTDALNGS